METTVVTRGWRAGPTHMVNGHGPGQSWSWLQLVHINYDIVVKNDNDLWLMIVIA